MSGLLSQADKDQLEQWIGGQKSFQLLYSVTRDGCSAKTFHEKCGNKGPTITVLYNTNKTVFGGYASVSWRNESGYRYVYDGTAFLFRLHLNGSRLPAKCPIKSDMFENAIHDDIDYGPTFGNYDIKTFSGSVSSSSGNFALNGDIDVGMTYNMQDLSAVDFCNSSLEVTELEVYKVIDDNTPRHPWRSFLDWGSETLGQIKEEIENYKPPSKFSCIQSRILLLGPVGAGKSSFYNTINSIFRGRPTQQSCSGSAEQSLTTVYRQYQVRSSSGSPLKFRLCDTRGLEEGQGLDVQDVTHLLQGNVPNEYQFNPSTPISPEIPGFRNKPQLKDQIHCVAFVVDGSSFDVCPEKVVEKIKRSQLRMNQMNIPQVVLLTKVDKIDKVLEKDISKIFHSKSIKSMVDKVSQVIGIPRNNVIPVKNYEQETALDDKTSLLAVVAIRQMIWFADDFLFNSLDRLEDETAGEA